MAGGLVLGAGVSPSRADTASIAPNTLPVPVSNAANIASLGNAALTTNGAAMNIKQTGDKAIIEWNSFNIGAQASVNFQQDSASSVALNNIHQADASQILGKLTANGQVYLVNQNGFLFGKDSQVNVNTLVATTLGISEETFKAGITKVFDLHKADGDYEKSAAAFYNEHPEIYVKDQDGRVIKDENGQPVKIQIFVQSGAKIKTNAPGGRVILAAPAVTNEGTIETPDGQTIIAAAKDKVYLQEAGSDSDVRGLLVEVGTGGDANNVGKLLAERGNVSVIGFAVNQKGIASATTSVQLNGSVRLLAREGILSNSQADGKLVGARTTRAVADPDDGLGTSASVTLAGGSRTSVDLDSDKSATAIDSQTQDASKIEISGHKVTLASGSLVEAKAGDVDISAIDSVANQHDARIYLEQGSKVDVSGVKDVEIDVARNSLQVELRKNELRDSPLQRDGILYGKKVSVDLRDVDLQYADDGSLQTANVPIADVKGAVDRIARNIDERSTDGGSINLKSSGDVIVKSGSNLDISGGSVKYTAGQMQTTKLVSGNQVFDIASADPNRTYDKVFTQTYFDPGYVDGKDGGQLNISGYRAVLDGNLQGQTVNGIYQRSAADRAAASSLNIDLSFANQFSQQNVVFDANVVAQSLTADEPLPGNPVAPQQPMALTIDTGSLRRSGIGNVKVRTLGSVTVDQDAEINLPGQGKLNLTAKNFDVQGRIVIPSGEVTLQAITLPGQAAPQVSHVSLGSSALIDVSGIWVNDALDLRQHRALGALDINGGKVTLASEAADLTLSAGSRILANGGAWKRGNARVTAGDGGAIGLSSGSKTPGVNPGNLIVDGELSAWSLQRGGSLALSANEVVIGSASAAPSRGNASLRPLVLTPEFFAKGGFSSFDIASNFYGLRVADNVQLNLLQRNLELTRAQSSAATGARLSPDKTVLLPDYLRQAVNLSLSSVGLAGQNTQESLTIGRGAVISTEAGGSIKLNSDTSIFVNGTLSAPGGKIALNIDTPVVATGYLASQAIWLGANSQLLARGIFDPEFSPVGYRYGEVLSGGQIDLTAKRGYIVSDATSLIDASGTTASVDIQGVGGKAATTVASAGGRINLKTGEGMMLDGELRAKAGDTRAAGGTLSVAIDRGLRGKPEQMDSNHKFPDDVNPSESFRIEVTSSDTPVVAGLTQGNDIPLSASGRALLKSSQVNNGGFDSLLLKTDAASNAANQYTSGVLFTGNVDLNVARQIVIDAPSLQGNGGQVNLRAAYVALGSTQTQGKTTIAPAAIGGVGRFDVQAQGIDLIGGLGFDGFGQVGLYSQGDLRLRGVVSSTAKTNLGQLNVNGDLTIGATQIYPSTLTDYTINLTGNGTQTATFVNAPGHAAPVLSAGGKLTVNAANIRQQGSLKAPFGSLKLNAGNSLTLADGSVTSVSGDGLLVPFGQGSGGDQWLYPLSSDGGTNIVVKTPPEKRLELSAAHIELASGATVDLSGGGDLYAYEFIPGPGGSQDTLDARAPGYVEKYAVLPGFSNVLTPYDPLEFSASGLTVGDSVYLAGGGGLAAGWYTLLPAHYALLPGAYLVTPQAGTRDQSFNTENLAGTPVVAGQYGVAATGSRDGRWQGFVVEPGSIARSRSQYVDYSANQFFAAKAAADGQVAPQLPRDAGNLVIEAQSSLTLAANLLANPSGNGLGGQVDITGDRLLLVDSADDLATVSAGTLGLLVDDLNRLNAPSLLLGGKRGKDAKGDRITVSSKEVTVAAGAHLAGQEIILAATDKVSLASGASVASSGQSAGRDSTLLVDNSLGKSDAALLRVSNVGQADVLRDKALSGNGGVLQVDAGATVKSDGAALLDSSKNTVFNGNIDMDGGSLALNSSVISIGNAPAGTAGLVLHDANFTLDELRLTSASDLNLYGSVGLDTGNLFISAANINGYGGGGDTATLKADSIYLTNRGAVSVATGNGNGVLNLQAKDIALASGSYGLTGFRQVNLNADHALTGVGQQRAASNGNSSIAAPANLRVAGNLSIEAGYIGGGAGATTSVDARGYHVSLASVAGNASEVAGGLGARWSIKGDSIDSSAVFDLPSGILELAALNGDLRLLDGSSIDLSGRIVNFADVSKASSAGSLALSSVGGNVELAQGASIDLAGANLSRDGVVRQVSDAGRLSVVAQNGRFVWVGVIDAKGNAAAVADSGLGQGDFTLDVDNFGGAGFSGLNEKLAAASLAGQLNLTQRHGDVRIAESDTVKARSFLLNAEQGRVDIDGKIDVSDKTAGEVAVYARNGIALGATASIHASATDAGAEGGKVTLDTVHRDDSDSGVLDLSAGGTIDVAGGRDGEGGRLHLRTGRNAANVVQISAINTQITGLAPQQGVLEATRVYNKTSIGSGDIAAWKNDTAGFMQNRAPLLNHSGAEIEVLPGIEVRSSGNLTLNSTWDFMAGDWSYDTSSWNGDWRYANDNGVKALPGFLTLRAAGDLNINASLTDAFAETPVPGRQIFDDNGEPILIFQPNTLQPGRSWSYSLIAGNRVNLAHSDASSQQVMVRTGTGDIDIKAGSDVRFLSNANNTKAAAVYTVGAPNSYTMSQLLAGEVPGIPAIGDGEALSTYLARLEPKQLNELLRFGYLNDLLLSFNYYPAVEYPQHGGDVSIQAGGDIQGVQTGQLISDWLVRFGGGNKPTGWGIDVGSDSSHYFNQNIGALGGGNIRVAASGSIKQLSVMLPSTGKPLGVVDEDENWSLNRPVVNGGGTMDVSAGRDIVGGEFFVGRGVARLQAGDSIAQGDIANSSRKIGALLEVGDARFDLRARNDIQLATAMNPTMTARDPGSIPASAEGLDTRFFSYGDRSALNLSATAGNVVLANDFDAVKAWKKLSSAAGDGFEYLVYPSTLNAEALSGDIRINKSMTLFPSALGDLNLLAYGNIGSDTVAGSKIYLNMSDVDPNLLPSPEKPAANFQGSANTLAPKLLSPLTPAQYLHAATPLHDNDTTQPLIVAKTGSIAFAADLDAAFHLPQSASVIAGKDIANLSISAQNLSAHDVFLIQAGGNIGFKPKYDDNGKALTSSADASGPQFFKLGGPGQLQVVAGGNLNLGTSDGIQTLGDLLNQALSGRGNRVVDPATGKESPGPTGAAVDVLVGVSGSPDIAGFIDKYRAQYPEKLQGLTDLDASELQRHLGVILEVLFDEIKLAAQGAAGATQDQRGAFYKRGYDAIAALFPGDGYRGDLSMVFSQIKTLAGGGINLAVPGGKIDVGLAGKQKAADQLGVVVQQQGDLNILAHGNINVNQSRLFTMVGGNIVAWSSRGNIDAGKGAKSVISAPKPITVTDANGNTKTTFPPLFSGSGIQAIGGGDVYLAAPEGIIDAGEAGISGGKITVAALTIKGADNFSASSGTSGVPTSVAVSTVPSGADGAAASASKSSDPATAAGNGKDAGGEEGKQKSSVALLSADVVGYGDCSVGDIKSGKQGCGG